MAVRLRVNGAERDVDARPSDPLLWVLRDDLGLLAAKYGCGVEQCGSCRVLVDGRAVASCTLLAGDAQRRDIETLEALRDEPRVQRIIDALTAINAGQCAYCIPGIVVTLAGLARGADEAGPPGSRIDRAALIAALDDHLCRCGSQPRIIAAAMAALDITPASPDSDG